MTETELFVLTREWRDVDGRTRLVFWGATSEGVARVVVTREEPVFFVERGVVARGRQKPVELRSMAGEPVDAVRFPTRAALLDERDRLRIAGKPALESDVKPSDRWLMERFVTGAMRVRGRAAAREGFVEIVDPTKTTALDAPPPRPLRVAALDIETLDPDGPLLSIAVASREDERVWVVGEPGIDERAALHAFVDWVTRHDPDVLAGWSVAEFDLAILERRCDALGVPFAIGRGRERARVLDGTPPIARVAGRVVLDGPQTLRAATYAFESYRLGDVAQELVGRGKKIARGVDPVEEIRRMYAEDRPALAAYNLEDCRLVLDVLDAADLLGFAVERQRLTGLPMDKAGGSVAAFDHLYLPRMHRAGYVAPDVGDGPEPAEAPGGAVLESLPGIYENVLLFDFRSLYPSIIRTWKVDPLGLVLPGDDRIEGFDGASFAREGSILPELIDGLWAARTAARAEGRAAMSTAIKILMNSFYGVLGTPGCRFFDPRLAASITRRGHEVIARSRALIEERGRTVIYGDTDSLFVLVGAGATEDEALAEGRRTADALNAWWRETILREHRLESRLELRFETHFLRFLMPTLRHSERGTKKRYAGAVRAKDGGVEIVIKGLEAVRTDWTPLAREAQRELVRRILEGEPWQAWLSGLAADVLAGRVDDKLVYTKRLRRELDAYAADGDGAPAHVRAARL
ncbi:MAG TPA: DNA polymerase II, partial [Minicystis sp.]|nr:DNA polymerase II [Minicystis sp.]